jgi:hypothetical protein
MRPLRKREALSGHIQVNERDEVVFNPMSRINWPNYATREMPSSRGVGEYDLVMITPV